MLVYLNTMSLLLGAGSRNASARNFISGAPVFTFELSLLRVSARHPRAVCVTEFVRGFAAANLSWRQCTAATPNMIASCGHQRSSNNHQRRHLRITSLRCLPLECASGRRTSCVDHMPQKPHNAIIPITSKTHVPRVLASRLNFLSTELPPPPGTPFPLCSVLKKK